MPKRPLYLSNGGGGYDGHGGGIDRRSSRCDASCFQDFQSRSGDYSSSDESDNFGSTIVENDNDACFGEWLTQLVFNDNENDLTTHRVTAGDSEATTSDFSTFENNTKTPSNEIRVPTQEETIQKLREDMKKLTLEDRNDAYEDIQGVNQARVIDETPTLIDTTLREFQVAIDNIDEKVAYNLALGINPNYVNETNIKLRLMFLRADLFDATKAAQRFVHFLDWKLELFGRQKLCQPHIRLEDLDADTLSTLKSGRCQILPQRDASGRPVFISLQMIHQANFRSITSMIKFWWYILMSAIEHDDYTQRVGCVLIAFSAGPNFSPLNQDLDFELILKATSMQNCFPIRLTAIHHCFNNHTLVKAFANMWQLGLSPKERARIKFHYSNGYTELVYKLMEYGIPSNVLPITDDGLCNVKLTHHNKWLQRRQLKDAQLIPSTTKATASKNEMKQQELHCHNEWNEIELPTPLDVLLGKGKPIQAHQGNRRLHDIVSNHYTAYNNAGRGQKSIIAQQVMQQMYDSNGRFLKKKEQEESKGNRKDGFWIHATLDEARQKVQHAFRTKRGTSATSNSSSVSFRTVTTAAMANNSSGIHSDEELTTKRQKFQLQVDGEVNPIETIQPSNGLDKVGSSEEHAQGDHTITSLDDGKEEKQMDIVDVKELLQADLPVEEQGEEENVDFVAIDNDSKEHLSASSSTQGIDGAGVDLKGFCISQASCLKCSPMEFYDWLVAQDIESLNDLSEACDDADYLKNEMRTNGLKAYKRGPFLAAVTKAASGMK